MRNFISYVVVLLVFTLTLSEPVSAIGDFPFSSGRRGGSVSSPVNSAISFIDSVQLRRGQRFCRRFPRLCKKLGGGDEPHSVPEPGTVALLATLAASGLIVRKITRR